VKLRCPYPTISQSHHCESFPLPPAAFSIELPEPSKLADRGTRRNVLLFTIKVIGIATVAIGMLSAPGFCRAQPSAEGLKFEVAAIRPNKDAGQGSLVRTPDGLVARGAEFDRLVEMAFQTGLTDLSKIPPSLRSKRFDIVAEPAGTSTGRCANVEGPLGITLGNNDG
jgi:hypothetical protein